MNNVPTRIACLTEETTETLYLLEEDWRIVGISGFTVRPPRARREKPKVSSFLHARYEKIEALHPDLVLAFSDLQADITTELVKLTSKAGDIEQTSAALGAFLDLAASGGEALDQELSRNLRA